MGLPVREFKTDDARPSVAIGHVGLAVHDFSASLEFLKNLGIRQVAHMPGMAILELRGGTHIVLRHDPNAKAKAGTVPFDLMVDDIVDMRDHLAAEGYTPSAMMRGGVHTSFEVVGPSNMVYNFTSSHAVGPV